MADASRDLTAKLVKLVQAMQEIKSEEDSRVNSYEIFVNQKQTHIRNSRGVDVTFSGFDCEIEVVTNSRKDDHEIEIYKDLRFSDKSAEKIIAEVHGMFHTGRQRLNAVPTRQNEHADVLLSGDASAASSSILPCIPTLLISIWALQKQKSVNPSPARMLIR